MTCYFRDVIVGAPWVRRAAVLLSLFVVLALSSGCKPSEDDKVAPALKSPVATANPGHKPDRQQEPSEPQENKVPVFVDSGRILVEAESASTFEKPMIVATDADKACESGKVTFVWCPEGPGCKDISHDKDGNPIGKAVVKVKVGKSVRYWFWARVWSHCSCGDTCRFVLKKGAAVLMDFRMTQPTTKTWQWRRKPGKESKAAIELEPGEYELEILNIEDGMRIDKILFTDQPPSELVPVGPDP